MSKLLIFLCLFVATAYAKESSLLHSIHQKIHGVENDISETINSAIQGIKDFIDNPKEIIIEIRKELKKISQRISNNVYIAIHNFLKTVDKQVAEITAIAGRVDITDCVNEAKREINYLTDEITANVSSCVDARTKEANIYIEQLNITIQETFKNLTLLRNEFSECNEEGSNGSQNSDEAICCANAAIIKSVITDFKYVATEIRIISKLSWKVATIVIPSFEHCNDLASETALEKQANVILDNLNKCIQEKIHESHTSTTAH
ncbi:uncharacterized protein PF3D7_1120000-like [Prorops nasuta]|uniref:uncharacterized protein PF3D7_1120000-like n=1 Tax=Prorops nasuta TaxID=863751 RepID=UPI0034CF72F0